MRGPDAPAPLGAADDAYLAFLKAKTAAAPKAGFDVDPGDLHPRLKPHQRDVVRWAAAGGRRAIFAKFGLGKTTIGLELARLAVARTGRPAIIGAPLGVRHEFVREQGPAMGLAPVFAKRQADVPAGAEIVVTNFESLRDRKFDPAAFGAILLDEAAVLVAMGGSETARALLNGWEDVPHRWALTAIPAPNEYLELLAYAQWLGVMDVGQAKTRFFQRNSEKADALTIRPHKEAEFWHWVASWGLFLSRPSDLGHADEGYDLPPMRVVWHEVTAPDRARRAERDGQMILLPEAAIGVSETAAAKRESLGVRIAKTVEILAAAPAEHAVLWHDLEDERRAIEAALPGVRTVHGAMDPEAREDLVLGFGRGAFRLFAAKPVLCGAGTNLQAHCATAIFVGVGFKFRDFVNALHRIWRFGQTRPVTVHLIHADSERGVRRALEAKWRAHEEMVERMTTMVRDMGLTDAAMAQVLTRSLGVERIEVTGEAFRLVNEDCVREVRRMPDGAVQLVLTSIPFSTQYEYSPNYADFGHTDDDRHFWAQMGFLIPELLRVLEPGRIAAIHVKDRIVPGGVSGLGFQTLSTFHMDCVRAFRDAGFAYLGMKTIVTDVVRENNQTYRLGWTEQCKDGSRMGCGVPEYLLIFRRPPSDRSNGYADRPPAKAKKLWDPAAKAWTNPGGYSRARWQLDAHGFARSSGDRPLVPEEIAHLPSDVVWKVWKRHGLAEIYDYRHHVRVGETLEAAGRLPPTFMLLPPHSWHPDVWTDVARMRTLNSTQKAKGAEMHLCPLQFDIVDRAITQYTEPGETVLDPFAGIGTVPYRAVGLGRTGWGVELSPSYFLDAVAHCKRAEAGRGVPGLFDYLAAEDESVDHFSDAGEMVVPEPGAAPAEAA
jgi:hypothetical protein